MPDKNLYDGAAEISTNQDDEVFNKLLNEVENIAPSDEEVQKIFIRAIFEFLKGALSSDQLASLAGHMWSGRKDKDDELARALYCASELSFHIRRVYSPENPQKTGQFVPFMIEVMKYYEKYRE